MKINNNLVSGQQQISRLLILATFASLLLGHLQHYQLSKWLSFYAHDIFLSIFLLINLSSLKEMAGKFTHQLLKGWQKISSPFALAAISLLVILSSWFFAPSSLLLRALLYTGRLVAYLLFILLVVKKTFFIQRQKQQLLLTFFILFILLSWGQYLWYPDLRSLGYLGFDDHQARLIGLWFDPAFTGLTLLFASIYFAHTNLLKSPWRQLLLMLAVAGLLLTFSRAVYLALLVVIVFVLIKSAQVRAQLLAPTKIFFFVLGLLIAGLILSNFAKARPSNSLWRSHSVIIRLQSAQAQLFSLTFKDWLLGRGLFIPSSSYGKRLVPLQAVRPVENAPVVSRQTTNFSDNFLILLISFFGLPLTVVYLGQIFVLLQRCYRQYWSLFLMTVATLVVAQFNQTVFQPLIFLLLNYFFWSDFAAVGDKLKK